MPYTTPRNGLRAYAVPDPSQPPVATIPAGEPVEAIEWRGDWARVRCTNGWTGWVDGRVLCADEVAPAQFVGTHVVPGGGLAAWAMPEASQPPTNTVAAGLPVRVLAHNGAWAEIECSNGWRAWVDGNRLVAASEAPARVSVGAALSRRTRLGVLAAAGAALVVVSTFMPWFTFGSVHFDAWDVPLRYLVAGTGGTDGIKSGIPLLVPAVAAIAALARWSMPRWVALALGGVATNAAAFALARALRPEPHPSLGIGVVVAAAGGVLVAWDGWRSAR